MEFRCKEFSLNHSQSTMKVGTDSVLLAGLLAKEIDSDSFSPQNILDIGTGCGILSLCMAQIYPNSQVIAIDIDKLSIEESQNNFFLSPFHTQLQAIHSSLSSFYHDHIKNKDNILFNRAFNLIISNPPFFVQSLKGPNQRLNQARHCDSLPFQDLNLYVSRLLSKEGVFALILPANEYLIFHNYAIENNLIRIRQFNILPQKDKEVKRVVAFYMINSKESRDLIDPNSKEIIIRNSDNNNYTQDYKEITYPFLL